MSLTIIPLPDQRVECGYFQHKISTNEHFLVQNIDPDDLEMLLSRGFRHFGRYFFRPVCEDCGRCIPIRIDVEQYTETKSAKRLSKINGDLEIRITAPEPSMEAFRLYSVHKKRFGTGGTDSYEQFTKAFFYPLTGAFQLSIYLNGILISVGHFDETGGALSAVYTYYSEAHARRSLGTYTVNRLIRHAAERGKRYLYLGYFVEENRHMKYKARFYPSEISMKEGIWVPFVTCNNSTAPSIPEMPRFSVTDRLF